jgi:hypothetical protein
LLEKRDQPSAKSKTAFVALNSENNIYEAWGSFIKDPVYEWAKETNSKSPWADRVGGLHVLQVPAS